MLTDDKVAQRVEEELRADPQIDATDIAVTVKDPTADHGESMCCVC